MPLGRHFQLAGLLMCCWLSGNTALAQTPEPTAIKYPDATASPAVKAAFTQALEMCQAELRADYDRKMAKAVADGKPHLVPVLERLRDGHLVELCQVRAEIAAGEQRIAANKLAAADKLFSNVCGNNPRAFESAIKSDVVAALLERFKAVDVKITAGETDYAKTKLNDAEACYLFSQLRKQTESEGVLEALYRLSQLAASATDQVITAGEQRIAAGEQRIAAGEQRIAAGEQRIAANESLSGLYVDSKRIADKITSRTETPKDIADLQRTHQALKDMYAYRPDAGALRIIQLLDGLLAKYKRVQ